LARRLLCMKAGCEAQQGAEQRRYDAGGDAVERRHIL
jgi:hypothetical protein